MTISAGWYPDPHPDAPEGGLRWWDGVTWSDHTDAGESPAQPAQPTQPAEPTQPAQPAQPAETQPTVELHKSTAQSPPEQPQQALGYPQAQGYPQTPVYPQAQGYPAQGYPQQALAVPQMTHCPDGAALANPWARLGAHLLDALFGGIVALAIVMVVGLVLGGGAIALFSLGAGSDGSLEGAAGALGVGVASLLYVLMIVLSLAYSVWAYILRMRSHGATPGKQVLGLRVRTFHADGQLTYGQIWGRIGLPAIASGVTCGISPIVDYLWLLWDRHRQCLHDKAVGTVVVDTRAPLAPADHPGVVLARSFPPPRGWMADGPVPPGTTTASYKA